MIRHFFRKKRCIGCNSIPAYSCNSVDRKGQRGKHYRTVKERPGFLRDYEKGGKYYLPEELGKPQ